MKKLANNLTKHAPEIIASAVFQDKCFESIASQIFQEKSIIQTMWHLKKNIPT